MDFQANIPIYIQLMDVIKQQIVSGKLKANDKLPSVRDMALEYGVNPNTMQKALGELEWEKLVYTMRTSGRFVTEDQAIIDQLRQDMVREKVKQFLNDLMAMGYAKDEIIELLLTIAKEERI